VALTRLLAVGFGRQGIRVNCICPAGAETEMLKANNLDNQALDAPGLFCESAHGPLRPTGRDRQPGRVPRLGKVVVRERGDCPRRRRHRHHSNCLTLSIPTNPIKDPTQEQN